MYPFDRKTVPQPDILVKKAEIWGSEYADKKRANSSHEFTWRRYASEPSNHLVLPALIKLTQNHCSYCDGYPLGAQSRKTIDHFKPKSNPEFYKLAYDWLNLYLACDTCQNSKKETFDALLLRPDDSNFKFEKYFIYNGKTGELEPNLAADSTTQDRAKISIKIFGLNRDELCVSRMETIRNCELRIKDGDSRADLLSVIPYRFLIQDFS